MEAATFSKKLYKQKKTVTDRHPDILTDRHPAKEKIPYSLAQSVIRVVTILCEAMGKISFKKVLLSRSHRHNTRMSIPWLHCS